jgi:hypothetical protein
MPGICGTCIPGMPKPGIPGPAPGGGGGAPNPDPAAAGGVPNILVYSPGTAPAGGAAGKSRPPRAGTENEPVALDGWAGGGGASDPPAVGWPATGGSEKNFAKSLPGDADSGGAEAGNAACGGAGAVGGAANKSPNPPGGAAGGAAPRGPGGAGAPPCGAENKRVNSPAAGPGVAAPGGIPGAEGTGSVGTAGFAAGTGDPNSSSCPGCCGAENSLVNSPGGADGGWAGPGGACVVL